MMRFISSFSIIQEESGVRRLNRYIGALVRKAIKKFYLLKSQVLVVDNIISYIGKERFVIT